MILWRPGGGSGCPNAASNEPGLMEESCSNCWFWSADEDKESGKCHRYAPREISPAGWADWPRTLGFFWCGDYKDADDKYQQ